MFFFQMSPGHVSTLDSLNRIVLVPITLLCRVLFLLIISLLLRRLYVSGKKKNRVSVVVLGDIGRSPRMQYHALSLASHGFIVDIIGYTDSKPKDEVLASSTISLHGLAKENISKRCPRIIAYAVKFISQTLILSYKLLLKIHPSEFILMQNPPCIPAMFVCWVFSVFNGSKLVIDWHNYGYTILSLTLGKNHKLVKIAHLYEKIFGQLAAGEICVTKAMQEDLMNNWHVHATVLYDRPYEGFKPLQIHEKHDLFVRLREEYDVFGGESQESTFCTVLTDKRVCKVDSRPALIISSTSWTEDEDFSILLNALKLYEKTRASNEIPLPNVICAITGKGPMKEHYLKEITNHEWKYVSIITPWLSAEDYPLLIGSADVGVCLHTSSSGLDLPMKVVDMFGCGVPVLAVGFKCLDELIQHEENGVIFQNEEDLHNNLVSLLSGFPQKQTTLEKMRKNLEVFRKYTWKENWNDNVLPIFK